jgi:hypothetical protein
MMIPNVELRPYSRGKRRKAQYGDEREEPLRKRFAMYISLSGSTPN